VVGDGQGRRAATASELRSFSDNSGSDDEQAEKDALLRYYVTVERLSACLCLSFSDNSA